MFRTFLLLSALLCVLSCTSSRLPAEDYETENVIIRKISDHAWQHITYLQTESFGKVPCNGLIVFDKGEAVVFDTPADDSSSAVLLDWIEKELRCKVKAVVPTHFHNDCLGGLNEFHRRGAVSYAHRPTLRMADSMHAVVPQKGFDDRLEIKVGGKKVVTAYFGEGHTRDNVIGYFPEEKVMFGGCLIKETEASKGYLGDANVKEWSATVRRVKEGYPDVKVVIPGHGSTGGAELLDYTIQLFQPK